MKRTTYIDRTSGKREEELVYGERAIALLYGPFRFLAPLVARLSFLSRLYGYLQSQPRSRKKVAPFVEQYGIDLSECEKSSFDSFNDFFIRKLRKEARPIDEGIIIPADGRYWVTQNLTPQQNFYLKGKQLSIAQMLGDETLAERHQGGAAIFGRLAPVDCHRFLFPLSGTPSTPRLINGPLYSVNPKSLRHNVAILATNKRYLTLIETEKAGQVAMLEIGATCVGSVINPFIAEQAATKGEEKGYFQFGGSAIVLLFEPNSIRLENDLLDHSGQFLETRCLMGQKLGDFC